MQHAIVQPKVRVIPRAEDIASRVTVDLAVAWDDSCGLGLIEYEW